MKAASHDALVPVLLLGAALTAAGALYHRVISPRARYGAPRCLGLAKLYQSAGFEKSNRCDHCGGQKRTFGGMGADVDMCPQCDFYHERRSRKFDRL